MLGSGLCLYLPSLAGVVDRPTAKAWHIDSAVVLGVGLLVLIVLGDRRSLGRTLKEADRFDGDDLEWLRGGPRRVLVRSDEPPQGRLNAGQKLNTAITLGLMVVLALTGFLLWEGERDTAYRFAGTVLIHDIASLLIVALVCGHLYLALLHPATRHALRGITTGEVDRSWAEQHHAKWAAQAEPEEAAKT
jgi:formate dehydrogenase subunit gamma